MGHGLDLAVVEAQGRADEALAVAGDAGAGQVGAEGKVAVDRGQDAAGGGDGVVARLIVRVRDATGVVEQHGLDRGGARVDPQEQRTVRIREIDPVVGTSGVAGGEGVPLVVVGEERPQPGTDEWKHDGVGEPGAQHAGRGARRVVGGEQSGAESDIEVRVVGGDERVDLLGQRAFVGDPQVRQEVERASEEDDGATDGVPLREAGDRLRRDGLEDAGGQVGVGGPLVQERLQVGLGEDAAPRRDRVEVVGAARQLVEAGRVRV